MRQAIATARQAAASDVPVLLVGEVGTGKRSLAAAIHDWSPRRSGPLARLSCTARSPGVPFVGWIGAGRETFPRESRALRAARAGFRGTLLLDEVGDLSSDDQAELLRVLGDRRVARIDGAEPDGMDARVVATTSHDLEAEPHAGRFRRDLFFRLSVVTIVLPPLRQRLEDLPVLTDRLLDHLATHHRRHPLTITPEASRALATYGWPGNASELANVLERAVVLASGTTIGIRDLPENVLAGGGTTGVLRDGSLKEVERQQVRRALAESPTLGAAAAKLGINRTSLWRKRKRWGLE
jgi:DNA-binding NtrC family response regulator